MIVLNKDKFSNAGPVWTKSNMDFENFKNFKKVLETEKFRIRNIYKNKGLEINSTNFYLKINNKRVIVKFSEKIDKSKFKKLFNLYSLLDELNLSCVRLSRILLNRAIKEHTYNNNIFVFDFLEGRYFNGSYSDLKTCGPSIKSFQKKIKRIDNKNFNELTFPDNFSDQYNTFYDLFEKEKIKFPSFQKNIIKNSKSLVKKELEKINNYLVFISKEKTEPFHIDLHPHNILIKKNYASFLDLDSIMLTKWPVADGFNCFKLLRQTLTEGRKEKVFFKNAIKFVRNSSDYFDHPNFYELLYCGAKVEVLRRLFYILNQNIEEGFSPWNEVIEIQMNSLKEINWMKNFFLKN